MTQRVVGFTLLGGALLLLFIAGRDAFRLQDCYEALGDFAQCDALFKPKSGLRALLFSPYFLPVAVAISFAAGWLLRALSKSKPKP